MTGRPLAGDRDAILADYRAGVLVRIIALRHGVSESTVGKYAKDAGLVGRLNAGCQCRAGRVCVNCAPSIPLTGGRWVLDKRRRVQVWVSDEDDWTTDELLTAHAAWTRGVRTQQVEVGERIYQRMKKRHQRARRDVA